MGAVNYFTSDYITMGIVPYDAADFENDPDFMREVRAQIDEYGGTVEDCISDMIESYYEDDEANISAILDKYIFVYFHVTIRPGYYEGFTLDIENNYPVAYDTWQDKRAAQREITQLKKCLLECAGCGMVECFPGWCTGYNDYKSTCNAIFRVVRDLRDEVRRTPTWLQYNRASA